MGLDVPAVPLAAEFIVASGAWSCTFDKPLKPGTLDFANWTMRPMGNVWNATSAVSAGAVVSGLATLGAPQFGAAIINFAPPPFDVVGVASQPTVAFSAFPLTVIV